METTHSRERLEKFVKHELTQIEKPGNPGQAHRFSNPGRLAKVLVDLLAFPIDEPTLQRLEPAFWNAVEPLLAEDLAVKSLPDCVEKLAATLESFLKKIAYIRYRTDTLRWSGDGTNYVGIVNTTLADLIRGLVGKTRAGETSPDLLAPIVDCRGTKGAIYGKAREVRNNVHRAQDYSLAEIIALARNVLASYLLAIEDNSLLVEQTIYPQYRYLEKVVAAFRSWEQQYIELEGQEEGFMADIGVLEPMAVECAFEPSTADEDDNPIQAAQSRTGQEQKDELETLNPRRRAPISKFVEEFPRLAIIASGGCGKTTTLQRLALEQAQNILSSHSSDLPLPVFVEANRYSLSFRFLDLIRNELGMSADSVSDLLDEGKLVLLIDGLNEITTQFQQEAVNELKNLMTRWPKPRVIVSSRKTGFQNLLSLPTFELQELSGAQIGQFLTMSFADSRRGQDLFKTLKSHPQLMAWARNPLLLRMLTKVAVTGDVPRNRGQMFKRFVTWILSRERKTHPTNVETKEDVLSHLAYQMRKAGNVVVEKPAAIELIREKLAHLSPNVGANDLFLELVENQLLKRTQNDEVRFFHELFQEYFAACELTRLFLLDSASITDAVRDVRWEEPIILMAGFLPKKEQLVQILIRTNLLLAAKSVASLRDEFPDVCGSVEAEAAKCLRQMCNEIVRQSWTRIDIRETVSAISILQDETAIRFFCERLSHFSIVAHDLILDGLAWCDKTIIHRILLDAELFERLAISPKRDYLIKLWFRAIEELNSVAEMEQAIQLCSRTRSALSLQVACAFNPEIALREINPFGLHLGEKSLRKMFSLVNAEKYSNFLRQQFSEEHNPLRFAAAIRLASIQDEIVFQFLIEKCVNGKQSSEQGAAFAALAHFGKERVSQAVFQLVSEGAITLHKLVACPLTGYVKLDEEILKASDTVRDYLAQMLESGPDQQTKFALAQIVRLNLGEVFRKELVTLARPNRFQDASLDLKHHMRVYEALKGQRFHGIILLLDTARGIGSIWCDETQQFYFLHQSEVWDSAPVAIYDAVEFEVATGRKPKKDFEATQVSKLPEKRLQGIVEKVLPDRRFGLISFPSEKAPIFFHFENVAATEVDRIAPKTRVSFIVVPRLKETQSVQAVRVRLQYERLQCGNQAATASR